MNLALKDIRHGLFRFVLTCFGLGLLMTVVLSVNGGVKTGHGAEQKSATVALA